jgi:hypothetical protein
MDIDKEIAEKVMGWSEKEYSNIVAVLDSGFCRQKWSPSTNMNTAMKIVERLYEIGWTEFSLDRDNIGWEASFSNPNTGRVERDADNLPTMAICKAALKAVEG